jgi:RNA polymerase sigma-70 factor (ECF subfamily)
MKLNTTQPQAGAAQRAGDHTAQLKKFIEDKKESLTGILRSYVVKGKLASGESVEDATNDLLDEMTVEALKSAANFNPAVHPPRAWLLKIAANLVLRKQRHSRQRREREVLMRDISAGSTGGTAGDAASDRMSDADYFDRIAGQILTGQITPDKETSWAVPFIRAGAQDELEEENAVTELLSSVSAEDQKVLRLAIINELEGEELAKTLGISHGTARVRLHRAINRLRKRLQNKN